MNIQPKSVTMRVYTPHAITHMGRVHQTPIQVFKEYLSNSFDAQSKNATLYLWPDRFVFLDDGVGMVPYMTDNDRIVVEEYFQKGGTKTVDELKEILHNSPSLHSLEWMATCVALSEKFVRDDQKSHGNKAMGGLAFLSIANKLEVFSKPSLELAKRFYGVDHQNHSQVSIAKMTLPTAQELNAGLLSAHIEEATQISHPWSKTLIQGTMVVISDLRENVIDSFRPVSTSDSLGKEFAEELVGGFNIKIIGNLTKEEKDVRGKIYSVQPPSHRLPALIDEEMETSKGDKFRVTLYYDSTAVREVPMLKGAGKNTELTRIEELQHAPWSSGQLFGTVHYPAYSARKQNALWDSLKGAPAFSPERTRWLVALRTLEPRINAHIATVQKRAANKSTQRLNEALENAVAAAIKDMKDIFSGRGLDVPDTKTKEPKPKPQGPKVVKEKKINRSVRIGVMNENQNGVPNISVELWKDQQLVETLETGISGHVSFGKLENGRYKVQLLVPKDITCPGDRFAEFIIHHLHHPGFTCIFHLIDGRAPSQASSLEQARITSIFQQLPDPFEPWQHRFAEKKPILIINTEGEELREALDDHNYTRVKFLLANYYASAVCDGFVNPPTKRELLIYQNRLSARIEYHLGREFESDLRRLAAKDKE